MKNLPKKLQMNALKVKAAQDPSKPGAEKPDLGAPGKKPKGLVDKMKGINREHTAQGPKMKKNAPDGAVEKLKFYNREHTAQGKMKKNASLDDQFDSDMRQIVGVEPGIKEAGWDRPDVSVENQITDRIDDHYLGWMQNKSDEDVVKIAINITPAMEREAMDLAKDPAMLRRIKLKSGGKGALATAAVLAAAAGGHKLLKNRSEKTAGVIANAENEELLARLFGKKNGQKI